MSVKFIATSCLGGPRPPRARVGLATLMLALTIAAVALVAALCASSASGEIDRALRLSWWFS
ncbi:MAG TPA: hypothetical protein VG320_12485 [Paraburkholderia sp.]|uniref:hypothetical protein n=1 Tax=Paraburkholderia sp. TaxID=1926495 RepID=UPI002DE9C294|nr:hypothetical protein [Paraburkholderia sp.]